MLRTQTAGIAAVLQSCSGVVFVSGLVPAVLTSELHRPSHALGAVRWMGREDRLVSLWSPHLDICLTPTGFFFCGLATLFTILVWFTVPETKGLSYGEIDELFERRTPAWRFSRAAAALKAEQPSG